MRSDIIIVGGLLLFAALVIAGIRPEESKSSTWVTERGMVTDVYQTGLRDLVVKLKGHGKDYYIDISSQAGSFADLKEKLLYKNVVIQYPDHWKPMKADNNRFYISKLEHEGEIIYAED